MATTQIPLVDTVRQTLLVRLSGQDCRLSVWWQPNDRGWYAALEVPTGTPIIRGRRLATDADLLARGLHPLPGALRCRSITGSDAEPGLHAWGPGGTHVVRYEV